MHRSAVAQLAIPEAGPGRASSSRGRVSPSLARGYRSLGELRHAARSVALVRPTSATTVTKIGVVPFTTRVVDVMETLAGEPLPHAIGLRQIGAAGAVGIITVGGPLVSSGDIYIIYLQAFEFIRGEAILGGYVAVGGVQGLFRHAGRTRPADDSDLGFEWTGPAASSLLPARISIAQARQN